MKRIKKVWGEEQVIVNRKDYCGKLLFLNKGYRSSSHYHQKKDETFYVFRGKILMEVGKKKWIMKHGDIQHIAPMCIHRFTGLTDAGIIEFSTHHNDLDSYRKILSGKAKLRKAYDYDGVVRKGIKPEKGAPIITGRSFEQIGIPQIKNCAIYYNPVTWNKKTLNNEANWKAYMINRLKIEEFYEDDCKVIEFLKKKCPNCNIIKI